MANTITSLNMNLPIPIPGVDPGPDYALNIGAALTSIDGHNHTSGSGVQIPPAGLNINSALTFQNNQATNLQASVYSAQSSLAVLDAVYVSGVDLYFNDGNGNVIRITQAGSVTGSAGTITGLPSGTAGAAYNAVSGTFVFTSASLTPANLDGESIVLRNNVASSKGLTLSPPAAMAANFNLVLPSLPGTPQFMTLDTSGNMGTASNISAAQIAAASITGSQLANLTVGTAQIAALAVTRPKLAAVGQQVSASCGNFSTNNTTFTNVTNLSVTITTSGRPVMLIMQPDTSASQSWYGVQESGPNNNTASFGFARGGTIFTFVTANLIGATTYQLFPGTLTYLDTPTAGTYTYTVQVAQLNTAQSSIITVRNYVLVAYEL